MGRFGDEGGTVRDPEQGEGAPPAGDGSAESHDPGRGTARELLIAGCHLAALSAFAFAQPLFDLLSRNPEFFAARGSPPSEIVVFALAITLVPPAVLLGIELLAGLVSRRLRRVLHLVFVGALTALVVLQAATRLDVGSGILLLGAAAAIGAGAALVYVRFPLARSLLTLLALAPVLFLGLFLLGSPVSRLVFPEEQTAHAAEVRSTTPVVLLVFDELPTVALLDAQGEIDAERYPAFAGLAREATWYRNATTVNAHTHLAVPAILTGLVPEKGALPVFSDHPDNLFTLLGDDYDLVALETLTRLCPAGLCRRGSAPPEPVAERQESLWLDIGVVYAHLTLPDPFRSRLPSVSDGWTNFLGQDADEDAEAAPEPAASPAVLAGTQAAQAAIPSCLRKLCKFAGLVQPPVRPTLYYLHALLPHAPWRYLPSGRSYPADAERMPGNREGRWGRDESLITLGYQRMLLQLGYTDRALGVVLDRLREEGVYDEALVIVVADHGGSFRPGLTRRNAVPESLVDLAFVPLLVKLPGQREGSVDDSFARTVDVLPTIADVLDVTVPWDVDGRSLAAGGGEPDGTVSLPDQKGKPVAASLSTLLERRDAELAKQVAQFGSGSWEGVYRAGRGSPLLGASVADLDVAAGAGEVRIAGQKRLRSYDPAGAVSPSFLTGTIAGREPGETLAVALNGTVVALARSYSEDGRTRIAVLVPEDALRAGANDVAVYAVRQTGGGAATLEALALR